MNKLKAALTAIALIALILFGVFFVRIKPDEKLYLTAEEKQYLQALSPIKIAVDPDWDPFEKLNTKGEYIGMGADYVKLIEKRLNIKFEVVPTKDWNQSLQYSKEGKVTILPLLNKTAEREKWLVFTEPLIVDDNVIIGRYDSSYISDLHKEEGKTVALPEGTSVEERIRRDYPNLSIRLVESENEALELVSNKEADFTIRSMLVSSYNIRKQGWFDLKVIGKVPDYTNYLAMGVLKDHERLRNILNKAILSITEQDRVDILNIHVPIRVEIDDNRRLVFIFLGIAVAVGCLLLVLSLIQSMRAKQLVKQNREIQEITDRYEALSELAGTFFWQLNKAGVYTYVSPEVTKVLGFEVKELLNQEYRKYIQSESLAVYENAVKSGQTIKNQELQHYKKDGSLVWIKVDAMPIFDQSGGIEACEGSSTDIEEQKQLENALIDAKNETELAYYQAQIGPHFLYNALNAIAMYCLTAPQEASNLIVDLSFFLRKSFNFKNVEYFVTLEEELELIEAYINIEKVRFQDRLQVHYEIEGVSKRQQLPPLILQPLVENAINHGLMKRIEGGNIVIRAVSCGDKVLFEVADDGVGIAEEQIQALQKAVEEHMQGSKIKENSFKRQGIGLKNIHLRLMKAYHSKLNITCNEKGGTTVSFMLPVMLKGEVK